MRKFSISLSVLVNGQLINSEYFQVSKYLIQKSRDFGKENGVLSLPLQKKGKSVSHEMKEEIVSFCENDEISKIMPGKKDYISIGRNMHKQKRLLLTNLKELYAIFKSKYPTRQIRFSKFCSLCPKWCVLSGSSGTHSICVHSSPKHEINSCTTWCIAHRRTI